MLSFRVAESDAELVRRWAAELGTDCSHVLRTALRQHLTRLANESDVRHWVDTPLTAHEASLGEVAVWGPAEDWSDWSDAAR